jgi:hypothetical protein
MRTMISKLQQALLPEHACCDRTYLPCWNVDSGSPIGKIIDIASAPQLEPAALLNLTMERLSKHGSDRIAADRSK